MTLSITSPLWFSYADGSGAAFELDLVDERLLEHLEVLDVGNLSCTHGLELSLGLLQKFIHGVNHVTALALVRRWVWGTLQT